MMMKVFWSLFFNRPKWSYWLLASAWTNPSVVGIPFFLTVSAFQTIKNK